ncbi:CobQ/CobB/MinD/ParA family nucleotide binding protein [Paraburkholderia sp. BL10I2N1]|nr:CobQ/CobB/MinD/ParA family nucleotide binding protein [Paraburkholderia sp. BL10I2N1]
MATNNPPIYMIGGSKGGVGKSFVTLALLDYLRRTDVNVVLVETDTSNPDVMKAVHDEIECGSCDLDDVSGWIDFVNFCDMHRDATVVLNTAGRSQAGVAQYGGTLANTLGELGRRLVVLWVINRQRDSLELLLKFGATSLMQSRTLCATATSGRRRNSPCTGSRNCARPSRLRDSRWTFQISRIVSRMNCAASACRSARRRKRCISVSGRNCCAGARCAARCLRG